MKRLLVMLIMIVLSFPLVSYGFNLSGFGSATIDGTMSTGEWDNAAKVDFQANVPSSDGGGTTPATLYIMNDGLNLYLAVKITRSSYGFLTYFVDDFDNKNVGTPQDGDDGLEMYVGTSIPLTFFDMYRYTCVGAPAGSAACSTFDTNTKPNPGPGILPAGSTDGAGAAKNDGSVTFMEISHLLCNTTDTPHDFCLKPGDTVGLKANLRLYNITGPITSADTMIPVSGTTTALLSVGSGGSYGQITIASSIVTRLIDIKPGSRENPINRKSEGKIPVAILSTADWSVPTNVDRTSLTFGRTGDEHSLAFCNEDSQDVNNDGLPDLVCHFSTQLTGFQAGDTFGILNGKTKDGAAFTAKDSVRIVK
jgi:hypothetical protein